MKITNKILVIFLAIAFIGFIFKFIHWPGGGFILVIGMGISSVLALVQIVLGFFIPNTSLVLRVICGFINYSLFFSLIAILFRYMWWSGWVPICFFAIIFFLISMVVIFVKRREFFSDELKKVALWNFVVPGLFALFLGLIPIVLSKKSLYDNFSNRRDVMTYEEFLQQQK